MFHTVARLSGTEDEEFEELEEELHSNRVHLNCCSGVLSLTVHLSSDSTSPASDYYL